MTTTLEIKKFFVYGIENAKGITFHGIKEATLVASIISDIIKFYNNIGFKNVVATNCNDNVFVKDSTGRLLAFAVEVCHLKAYGTKEYRTAYWAWNEVNRQAEAVAEKAAAEAKKKGGREVATEKSATIKGSIEVKSPQPKKTIYYAVRKGRTIGIFTNWGEASESVTGYSGAVFKKFSVLKDAEEYIKGGDDE